jgi:hypothetical protein
LTCDVTKTKDPFKEYQKENELLKDLQSRDNIDDSDIELLRTRFKLESDVENESVFSEKKKNDEDTGEKKLSEKEIFDRLLLTTFYDGNVTYHNCDELVEKQEIDMSKLILIYSCLI